MGAYFKPWRRKTGVVTLMMACVFMAGWLRSVSDVTKMDFSNGTRLYSWNGTISYGVVTQAGCLVWLENEWTAPYWSIVTPLTTLSAWLLLSTPRAKKALEKQG